MAQDDNDNPLEEKIAIDTHIRAMENSFAAGCLFGIFITIILLIGTWLLILLVQNVKI